MTSIGAVRGTADESAGTGTNNCDNRPAGHVALMVDSGMVMVQAADHGQRGGWFSPHQARALACLLNDAADKAERTRQA